MTADVERVQRELRRLPIFPLPGIALLPGALLPLHVFEPRYRRLVRDCSRGAGVLGLACIPNGEEGISDPLRKPRVLPVLGAGVLARIERLPDGRSNIVVRGVLRAHIESEHEALEPYRIVDATALSDELSEGGLGIAIIQALADELEIGRRNGGGSRLRFVKRLVN